MLISNGNSSGKTLAGVSWTALSTGVHIGLQLVLTTMLMRMLEPSVFGVMATALVFTGMLRVVGTFGLTKAVVQDDAASDTDLSSVFWFNLLFGLIGAGVLVFLSGLLVDMYRMDSLEHVLFALAVVNMIVVVGATSSAVIQKRLAFKKHSNIEMIASVIAFGVVIVGMRLDLGIWLLVLHQFTLALVQTALFATSASWRPSFVLSFETLKRYAEFTFSLIGSQTVNYLSLNFDKLVIGRFLGDHALGVYRNSQVITITPLSSVSAILFRVLFPTFSSQQNDLTLLARYYLVLTETIVLLVLPLCFFATAHAFESVEILFGAKWIQVAEILPWMSMSALLFLLSSAHGPFYLALGKANALLKINLCARIPFVLGVFLIYDHGVFTITIILFLSFLFSFLLNLWVMANILQLSLRLYSLTLIRAAVPVLLTGLATHIVHGLALSQYFHGMIVTLVFLVCTTALTLIIFKPYIYRVILTKILQ